jgi:flagellar biosynthesis/type III secretory pathway protein FliH
MDQKIGEGHVAAMARLGLKELRNALNPSRESVADSEIGLVGTLTQGEIAEARGGPGHGPEQESPGRTISLDDLRGYAKELSQSEDRSKEQGKQQGKEQGKEQGDDRDRGAMER